MRETHHAGSTFRAMTKDFATFDCDAHVTEPPLIWERAKDFLTRDELDALKRISGGIADSRLLIVNAAPGSASARRARAGIPGTMRVITNCRAGVKHDIQRALNVRNLNPKTALTQEQVVLFGPCRLLRAEAAPQGHGHSRNRSGHDHPDRNRYLPLAGGRARRQGVLPRYNEWAMNIRWPIRNGCSSRRSFRCSTPITASRRSPSQRWAAELALVRPMDAMGNYPMQRNTSRSGTLSKRPAWSTACTRSLPSAVRSLRLQRAVFRRRVDPPHRLRHRGCRIPS